MARSRMTVVWVSHYPCRLAQAVDYVRFAQTRNGHVSQLEGTEERLDSYLGRSGRRFIAARDRSLPLGVDVELQLCSTSSSAPLGSIPHWRLFAL